MHDIHQFFTGFDVDAIRMYWLSVCWQTPPLATCTDKKEILDRWSQCMCPVGVFRSKAFVFLRGGSLLGARTTVHTHKVGPTALLTPAARSHVHDC